jgi:hypothetical protein
VAAVLVNEKITTFAHQAFAAAVFVILLGRLISAAYPGGTKRPYGAP